MHDRHHAHAAPRADDQQLETTDAEPSERTQFSSAGPKPPVASDGAEAAPSASERAYGPLDAGGKIMEHEQHVDGAAVAEASNRYGIPVADILAVITHESRGEANANAGASQKDHGKHAASGLMQVTAATWKATQDKHAELAHYSFDAYRYDRRVNILVGTAALADKRTALDRLGVPAKAVTGALATMAFNAGEGIVADAYHRAVQAGVKDPGDECLRAEFLKPAIAKYPAVYSYYLTGGGKKANPERSVQKAIDLKYKEISKYPVAVEQLVAEAHEHGMADGEHDLPKQPDAAPETQLA